MLVSTFLKKEISDLIEEIRNIKKEFEPDLYIFFFPSFFYTNSLNQELLKDVVYPSKCVSVSTIAAMKDNQLEYDHFGGVAIKFERKGFVDFFAVNKLKNKNLKSLKNEVLSFLKEDPNSTYLIFSTESNLEINHLLNLIFKKNSYPKVRLYGGVASSNLVNLFTFISFNGAIITDGFVIIKLGNVISYNTLSFGFISIGRTYQISKAKKNLIYLIEEEPAKIFIQRLLKDTGIEIKDLDDKEKVKFLWEFPFLLIDKRKGYVTSIRTLKRINEDALEFYGLVEENSLIKLSIGDSEDILNDVNTRAIELQSIITNQKRNPEWILNISCAARNLVLSDEQMEQEEQRTYYDVLKDYKLVGFLSFGEIGPDRFGNPGEFFNETSILVGFEEI
ncbi:MAG: FIST C-terminal domain-containing protein [Leptospiraceae bacterium]|nr:FIST C-terminal domain-containing protein [Leptospiraceae bacterium]MDW7976419.1 FIST C-terminal domain-containing protein [Leptospiraceae bacterium]